MTVRLNCSFCDNPLEFSNSYDNVKETDINCKKCGAILTIWTEMGIIHKVVLKEHGNLQK